MAIWREAGGTEMRWREKSRYQVERSEDIQEAGEVRTWMMVETETEQAGAGIIILAVKLDVHTNSSSCLLAPVETYSG